MNDSTYTLLLAQYNNFGECTLLDYWSEDLCRTLVLLVGSIWDASGQMHPKSDFVKPIGLVFGQCKKIDIYNSLPQDIVDNPDLATWGISEFARVKVQSIDDDFFQFRVLWENDRYIEVICRDFYLRPTPLTIEMKEKYHEFLG
jgi:hypothetical protein